MINRLSALIICILAITAATSRADDSALEWKGKIDYKATNENYWKSYVTNGVNLVTAPARWEKDDWLTAGFVAGGTAALYIFDERLMNFAQKNRSSFSNSLGDAGEKFGNELYVLPGVALLYLYGYEKEDKLASKTALLSLQSWFYSSAVTVALKRSFHRHRPLDGGPYDRWDGPGTGGDNVSFPSGHASTAWSVATVIATEYGDDPYVPYAAYTAAALTSYSRINSADHWASDVFFASCTGYFIGKAVVKWHTDDSFGRLAVFPVVDSQSAWLVMDYSF